MQAAWPACLDSLWPHMEWCCKQVGEAGSLGDDLLEHILSDWNSGGYELAMHWLFALFAQHIPVQAPSSSPEQLQQARASLSGTFSGFHPELPDPPPPAASLEGPSGSGPTPCAVQQASAATGTSLSHPQPAGHAQHSSNARPCPIDSQVPEQPVQNRDSQKPATGHGSQGLPEAGPDVSSSEPAGEANEHPEVVKGQTTGDVQRKLEGQGGADQAQADAMRQQGLPVQDVLTTAAEAGQTPRNMQSPPCCHPLPDLGPPI